MLSKQYSSAPSSVFDVPVGLFKNSWVLRNNYVILFYTCNFCICDVTNTTRSFCISFSVSIPGNEKASKQQSQNKWRTKKMFFIWTRLSYTSWYIETSFHLLQTLNVSSKFRLYLWKYNSWSFFVEAFFSTYFSPIGWLFKL